MQNTCLKSTYTTKRGNQPSRVTLLRMLLVLVGFTGVVVFGFLMENTLVPTTEAAVATANFGFDSVTNNLVIPSLLSIGLCAYIGMCVFGVYALHKVYRQYERSEKLS